MFSDDSPPSWSSVYEYADKIRKLLEENIQLRTVVDAVKSLRDESLKNDNWYTFVTCEFGERVDDALEVLEALEQK